MPTRNTEGIPSNTLGAIQQLLARELDLDPLRMDPMSPFEELGIDSLTLTECLFKLEDAFKVNIENSEFKANNLQEIADFIDRLVAARRFDKL